MRPEIVIVHVVDATDTLPHLDKATARDKICLNVIGVTKRTVYLVTETIVQSKAWLNLPVILQIKA